MRQRIEHRDLNLLVLRMLLQPGGQGGMALVTKDLRERPNDLLLQPGRRHGEHLHELRRRGNPATVPPSHIVLQLQRQSVERAEVLVQIGARREGGRL